MSTVTCTGVTRSKEFWFTMIKGKESSCNLNLFLESTNEEGPTGITFHS